MTRSPRAPARTRAHTVLARAARSTSPPSCAAMYVWANPGSPTCPTNAQRIVDEAACKSPGARPCHFCIGTGPHAHTHTHTHARTRTHAHARTRSHAHAHARTRTHAHIRSRTHAHTRMRARTQVRVRPRLWGFASEAAPTNLRRFPAATDTPLPAAAAVLAPAGAYSRPGSWTAPPSRR
jgi:hypothetical protein